MNRSAAPRSIAMSVTIGSATWNVFQNFGRLQDLDSRSQRPLALPKHEFGQSHSGFCSHVNCSLVGVPPGAICGATDTVIALLVHPRHCRTGGPEVVRYGREAPLGRGQ